MFQEYRRTPNIGCKGTIHCAPTICKSCQFWKFRPPSPINAVATVGNFPREPVEQLKPEALQEQMYLRM